MTIVLTKPGSSMRARTRHVPEELHDAQVGDEASYDRDSASFVALDDRGDAAGDY